MILPVKIVFVFKVKVTLLKVFNFSFYQLLVKNKIHVSTKNKNIKLVKFQLKNSSHCLKISLCCFIQEQGSNLKHLCGPQF